MLMGPAGRGGRSVDSMKITAGIYNRRNSGQNKTVQAAGGIAGDGLLAGVH